MFNFKPGDLVTQRIKSPKSQVMTVVNVATETQTSDDMVLCQWYDDKKNSHEQSFKVKSLRPESKIPATL